MALKLDNEIVHTTATEVIMQNSESFTNGTNGAILVSSKSIMGDLEATSMLGEIANIIGGRDINATTNATVKNLVSRDENNIKLFWGTGAIEFGLTEATRYGADANAFSVAVGEQIGKGIVNYLLNGAIAGLVGSISSQPTLITGDGTAKITHSLLNQGLKPMGDARGSVVAWVMNGATYADLLDGALAVTTYNVAGGAINDGAVGTLGLPTFVSDSPALAMATGVAVLGVTSSAINAIESASRNFVSEIISGGENLKYRIQAEGEFALDVKGYSWSAGTTNPSQVALATSTNWTMKASDVKSTAGVLINVA